jgi:hypothetical protein
MLAEYVVFITPTVLQLSMFYKILNPDKLNDLIQSSTAESLALINILTKISNSPILLKATADNAKNKKNGTVEPVQRRAVDDALALLPAKTHVADMSLSGKYFNHGLDDMQRILINLSSRKTVISRYNAQNDTPGKQKTIYLSDTDHICPEHKRKMCSCFSLHINSQYFRSLLQKVILFALSP